MPTKFTDVALGLHFLPVVIFWYILNSCPHTGCIVFKGQNSALLRHGCSETSKGLIPSLHILSYYTGSEKLGVLDVSYGICLCLDETSVWRHRLRTEKRCLHSCLSAALLRSTRFFRIKWSQVEVPCSGWEQGRSRCWWLRLLCDISCWLTWHNELVCLPRDGVALPLGIIWALLFLEEVVLVQLGPWNVVLEEI